MKKVEIIERYGTEEYKRRLSKNRSQSPTQQDVAKTRASAWFIAHPEEAKAHNNELGHKGGKRYEKHLEYMRSGLSGKRHGIRTKHGKHWRKYKNIVAPESELHHLWVPKTARYMGVALVEKNMHRHGIIKVIQILEGQITLLTEEETGLANISM